MPKLVYYICMGLDKLINTIANIQPFITSRIWCFWVGGFEEIEFVFRKY